jgi:transaldolase/glucose-6-phosphate isomerase
VETLTSWRNHAATAALADEVARGLRAWYAAGNTRRLWDGDATLWTGGDEARWLGWLHAASRQPEDLAPLVRLQAEVRHSDFTHALLLSPRRSERSRASRVCTCSTRPIRHK